MTTVASLDACIAYHGLLSPMSDADIRRLAVGRHIDPDALVARVAQLRAAAQLVVEAQLDYVERTRSSYALLKGVADADGDFSDRRVPTTEMDILRIVKQVQVKK